MLSWWSHFYKSGGWLALFRLSLIIFFDYLLPWRLGYQLITPRYKHILSRYCYFRRDGRYSSLIIIIDNVALSLSVFQHKEMQLDSKTSLSRIKMISYHCSIFYISTFVNFRTLPWLFISIPIGSALNLPNAWPLIRICIKGTCMAFFPSPYWPSLFRLSIWYGSVHLVSL